MDGLAVGSDARMNQNLGLLRHDRHNSNRSSSSHFQFRNQILLYHMMLDVELDDALVQVWEGELDSLLAHELAQVWEGELALVWGDELVQV